MCAAKTVEYSRDALRFLKRIPSDQAARIRGKVVQYAADPESLANNVKRLHGQPLWRLRIGDWRVLFDETRTIVLVVKTGPRSSVYL